MQVRGAKYLASEFKRRKLKNSRYSLRAFARDLGLAPSRVSEFLNGKRLLSIELAEKVAMALSYDPVKTAQFLDMLGFEQRPFTPLPEDTFNFISGWQHYAILSLMETDDFKSDVFWISSRLGITAEITKECLLRLQRLGLAKETSDGYIPTVKNLTTTHNISSETLRNVHKKNLQMASRILDEVPVELRDFTSMTMAIHPKDLPMAKQMIRSFRRRFCKTLESGEQKEVYQLNIQFFPVTRMKNNP